MYESLTTLQGINSDFLLISQELNQVVAIAHFKEQYSPQILLIYVPIKQ